jgi:pyruvate dehydrogenase E2 component (dihydrolipoyllysine-residue acetyltransferase)
VAEFHLPSIGDAHSEAEIREWLVEVGDEVALDQDLVEVETAKATVIIPSPYAGVLLERHGEPGDIMNVGDLLAVIGEAGEARVAPPAAPAAAAPAPGEERETLSLMRRTIAANLTRSWQEVPHVTLFGQADHRPLFERRRELGDRHGGRLPVEALLAKAISGVLAAFPVFNAYLDGDEVVHRREHDIGVAVDTEGGLVVPVVRSVQSRSVLELAGEIDGLAAAARSRALRPEQLQGNSFTLSNIGAAGGGWTTSVLPPMTSALLSVGAAGQAPMPLNLTIDHRLLDGALGARFLAAVRETIESPGALA